MDDAQLVALAVDLAAQAGTAILAIRRQGFDVRRKQDRSPVTEADEAAEAIIAAGLRSATPEIPVIAEEETAARGAGEAPAVFWLVDPLDGTREFIAKNGEFTVNVGLVENHRPVLGAVLLPVTGVLYAACGPGTATRTIGDAPPVPIRARRAPASGAIVAQSRSHSDEAKIAAYAATLPNAARRVMGSSAKFCLLAAGEADYYPRFGTTMEWDTAAGHAVLEAAGGSVRTLDGAPLAYGKPGFRNPDFIATGAAD